MSKLVKSSQIIIDKKKYVLNNQFFVPEAKVDLPQDEVEPEVEDSVEKKQSLEDELRLMKEEMLEAVKVEKDKILSETLAEKEHLIQEAFDQSGQIREKAQQEGYEAGFNQGVENGYGQLNDLIEEVLAEKEKYHDKYRQIKNESEREITSIIIDTVEKILNKRVSEDYELIEGLVEKALEKCGFTYHLTLRVAPEDYDHAISIRRYIMSLTENVEQIEIKQDNGLKPGSCVFDTDSGSVDSSVHTQFENVRTKFLELLQSE